MDEMRIEKVLNVMLVGKKGAWWQMELKGKDGKVKKMIMREVEEFVGNREVKVDF